MLRRPLSQASPWRKASVCLFCAARGHQLQSTQYRSFAATTALLKRPSASRRPRVRKCKSDRSTVKDRGNLDANVKPPQNEDTNDTTEVDEADGVEENPEDEQNAEPPHAENVEDTELQGKKRKKKKDQEVIMSLKEALLGPKKEKKKKERSTEPREPLEISVLYPEDLKFEPVKVDIPPVPMLSYGLDRVLFNSGVYRLQDPRSRVYNFDPYLEKIMPVNEFDFDALSEYKTSSKDTELLAITERVGAKFTGSTSSMSGILQHFHYVLSNFRKLTHSMLSREFPDPSGRFSKITLGPSAVFLRYKDGVYAIDADKTYDSPNIMSWLGHSLEKLLTTKRDDFERYRKSSPGKAPAEDNSSRCYHYSKQGNLLMRSQLDAYDPRLPGTGIFDLKTRAVVSIRMNHTQYEEGAGYQLRHARGEWESFEREFYDMTRATLLKYSLQVRMGRMDGIFIAYHNIERIFGFQYLSLSDMDAVLHGQQDTRLGDQEFKLSIGLLDELLTRATAQFPNTSIRLHFEARDVKTPFMYVFAEPVTEEQAEQIQSAGEAKQKEFARTVVGVGKDDPKVQEAWQNFQDDVDEQVDNDQDGLSTEAHDKEVASEDASEDAVPEEASEDAVPEEASDDAVPEEEATDGNEEIHSEVVEKETTTDEHASSASSPAPDTPLMGWTLTVRSKVNGGYVDRPQNLESLDDWRIEYHIQEIPQATRWKLYNAVKERRKNLIGLDEEEVSANLKSYRDMIQRYTDRGRAWRRKQDELNEGKGIQIFEPLGPGSEAESQKSHHRFQGETDIIPAETANSEAESADTKAKILEGLPPVPS